MSYRLRALALLSSVVIAACGGGGGGGGGSTPVGVAPPAVTITESTAKPVAASAMEAVQNTSATRGGSDLLLGVEVQAAGGQTPSSLLAMAQLARLASASAQGSVMATGVAISETEACELGGSITITGTVSGADGLVAGDNVAIQANSCKISTGGVTTTMNGAMSLTVLSGSASTVPFQVVLSVTASELSITSGSSTVVASGDARLEMTAASLTSQSLTATGASMSSRISAGGTTRTTTMKNYTQSVVLNGTVVSSTLAASVETSSTAVGAAGGSFTLTTPVAVVWDSVSLAVSAGVVKVVGANASQLLVTVGTGGSVNIQVDANGDGTYEKSIASTLAELKTLL